MHIAYIILTLIILLIGALPFGLCWGLAWLLRSKPLWALGLKWTGAALSTVVVIIFLIGFFYGWRNIQVTRYYFMHSDVPECFDGYKIVQLSDFHIGTLHGHESTVRAIVDSVNALEPDLIVFTGDLVNLHADEEREFHEILRGLHAKDGIVSVMGNHDYMMYAHGHRNAEGGRLKMTKAQVEDIHALQDAERDLGWHLLLNDNYVIRRGDASTSSEASSAEGAPGGEASIAIVGVENDGDGKHFPQFGDLTKAQHDLSPEVFKILLSHDPTHWKRRVLTETSIPLTLSGHTHAMQFQIGSWSPSSWVYPEWRGAYTYPNTEAFTRGDDYLRGDRDGTTGASQQRSTHRTLFVSSGVGEVGVPFRFGAWPEIVLITLRSK